MKPIKTLAVFGTRPEVIKMAPVIDLLNRSENFQPVTVATGQHREMQEQALHTFGINPDYSLNLMVPQESISDLAADTLRAVDKIITREDPDLILVQGDTTTAFIGCLAAFYKKKNVGHIEAGLRSHDKFHPFPEEVNRELITQLADYHFVPTEEEAHILRREGVDRLSLFITGNTVIDALFQVIKPHYRFHNPMLRRLSPGRRLLLVTSHRRENFGLPLMGICDAVESLVKMYPDIDVVFSVHRNPNVSLPVRSRLASREHVYLVDPLDYSDMANLMARCHLVLTDSGGLQEEAPALGKPLIVLRDVTERPEVVETGLARLVGTSSPAIISAVSELLTDSGKYSAMARCLSPYGDGHAARRIIDALEYLYKQRKKRPAPFHADTGSNGSINMGGMRAACLNAA